MKLLLRGHGERYALEQLQMCLFPDAPMEYTEEPFRDCDGAVSSLSAGEKYLTATARITLGGQTAFASRRVALERASVRERRRILQQSYYLAAVRLLPEPPPWGALSGVRPSKLPTKHLQEGGTLRSADRLLRDVFFVTPERRALCLDASQATLRAAARLEPHDLSLYIGIPFCPTRCAYCSFVSESIERCAGMLPEFFEALLRELSETARLLRDTPYRVRTIYIGGGTPTTLSAAQLARLTDAIRTDFDLSRLIEYTVEGGRPDTLTAEKLRVLREGGCDRVSINPQTMSDSVLRAVGRRHTAQDVLRAMREAREAGFTAVNMDLIAGLPGDCADSFAESLRAVLALEPENITVHTLALKKSAALFRSREALPMAEEVARMLRFANDALRGAGCAPYYLYRQKYMSGSFENVGWCKPGFEGLYNIYMMEELHTVLSLGGGGMTKVCFPDGSLVRFHNPKHPKEYLERFDSVLKEKTEIFSLLGRDGSKEL